MPTGTGGVDSDKEKERREKKERMLEFDKLVRDINKPRVARFQIKWWVRKRASSCSGVNSRTYGCAAAA